MMCILGLSAGASFRIVNMFVSKHRPHPVLSSAVAPPRTEQSSANIESPNNGHHGRRK